MLAGVALGLALRLLGLAFNGMYDLNQMIFDWGFSVKELGLAKAFSINYGVFSYMAYGWAAETVDFLPRYWWVGYKLMIVASELGVFWLLSQFFIASQKKWALWAYWLNPWMILHGSWQGFWEGPLMACVLLGLWCAKSDRISWLGWMGLGFGVMASAMFKPQGLFYFVVPLLFWVFWKLIFDRKDRLPFFVLVGMGAVIVWGCYLVVSNPAGPQSILYNFFSALRAVPNLCNDCLNGWRPATYGFMQILGQEGALYELKIRQDLYLAIHGSVTLLCLGGLFWVARWLAKNRPSFMSVYLLFCVSALLLPHFATKAHMNHAYSAIVLLIPFLNRSKTLFCGWLLMVLGNAYAHLATFWMGMHRMGPSNPEDFVYAKSWLLALYQNFPRENTDRLMLLHQEINTWIVRHLPIEPWTTLYSALTLIVVPILILELLKKKDGGHADSNL